MPSRTAADGETQQDFHCLIVIHMFLVVQVDMHRFFENMEVWSEQRAFALK